MTKNGIALPEWLSAGWSGLLTGCLALSALGAATAVVCSLLASLWLRLVRGASWGELGTVGDYWGGHLGAIALLFLALSLLLQRHEFQMQHEELKQNRAQFLLERLADAGTALDFAVVPLDASPGERRHQRGVRTLTTVLTTYYQSDEGIETIIVDEDPFADLIRLGRSVRAVLTKMPEDVREWSDVLLLTLFPSTLETFFEDLQAARREALTNLDALELRLDLKTRLRQLLASGWDFRFEDVAGEVAAALTRDTLTQTLSCSTRGCSCPDLESAVQRLLEVERMGGDASFWK